MKKTFLLTLVFALALAVHAATPKIIVVYNGNSVDVTIPDAVGDSVTYTTDGAHLTVNSSAKSEYEYELSGHSNDGSFTLNGDCKIILTLAGLNLTSQQGGAINIAFTGERRTEVDLKKNTTNIICDSEGGDQKAAMYFKGNVEFKKSGSLTVTGRSKHAISSKEELSVNNGTITFLGAVSDGIHCGAGKKTIGNTKNFFNMTGGTLNISGTQGDAIDTDDNGCVSITGGNINIDLSSNDTKGIKAEGTFVLGVVNDKGVMEAGTINAEVRGIDSDLISVCNGATFNGGNLYLTASGDGCKCIKGHVKSGYSSTGHLTFAGTNMELIATGGTSEVEGDIAHCVAISVDGNLTQTDGIVNIYTAGEDASALVVLGSDSKTGGERNITKTHWYANPHNYQYDMLANVTVSTEDNGQYEVGVFDGDNCIGYSLPSQNNQLISFRIYNNTPSGTPLTFKVYQQSTGKELTPVYEAQTFLSDGTIGTAKAPLLLTVEAGLLGDVNDDGVVNVTDVVELNRHLLEGTVDSLNKSIADINSDGVINITDVVELISMILK